MKKIYLSKNFSPYFNLSVEQILLENFEGEDIVFVYQHDNAIIIGKNQNTYEEVELEKIKSENISLARRISGGGAVYHDLGNINFSFITKNEKNNYEKFLNPIIEFLNSLGLKAKFKGRNDLVVNEAKISGNAQFILGNKMFHHGTLLFEANLAKLSTVLKPNKLKIESKGIKSIRQRVTNIRDELKLIHNDMDINTFINKLITFFEKKGYSFSKLPVEKYLHDIEKLENIRKSEDWILGKNPIFTVKEEAKFDGGIIKIKYNVENDKFKDIVFEGDFLSTKDLNDIILKIQNTPYKKSSLAEIFNQIDFENYFGKISKNEIINLIFK